MGAGVGGLSPKEALNSMIKAFEELGTGLNLYLYVIDEDIYREAVGALLEMGWIAEDEGTT